MASFLGEDVSFERAIADFATTYADLNQLLVDAIDSGRIPAVADV